MARQPTRPVVVEGPMKGNGYSLVGQKKSSKSATDYTSEGVKDNDVFLLPTSDYQIMGLITLLGAVVRLFRIYQPSSVVFDEVQYVLPLSRILPLS
jgi:dolichyl-phosphate-mannose-protein mannosyltransferase